MQISLLTGGSDDFADQVRDGTLDVALLGLADDGLSSSVMVHNIHADGDCVVVEHSGRNEMPDARRHDNNYCWVLRFQGELIHEVREYMDTHLVIDTFGADATS